MSCSKKTWYKSWGWAWKECNRIISQGHMPAHAYAYQCDGCNGYHISTQPNKRDYWYKKYKAATPDKSDDYQRMRELSKRLDLIP